jgi:hypothetical protein
MPLYSDIMSDSDPGRNSARVAAYKQYLQSISDLLPAETRDFVISDWYYSDFHRCPHDAWVENLEILENSSGDRSQHRDIAIRLRLLSASHAGHIHFRYQKVQAYDLNATLLRRSGNAKHEDWLADEISLASGGLQHEIRFSSGIVWKIVCGSVSYEYTPIEGKDQGTPEWARIK